MKFRNTNQHYGTISKSLHWLIAILVIGMLFLGYFMSDIKDKALFSQVINLHKLIGLTILILMIARLLWMLINPRPTLANTKAWERFLERAVHFLLYFVLIVMPLSGWIMSVAAGHIPHLFSWTIDLPIQKDKALAESSESIHNTLAIIIIVLLSIHVLAGLYHHFVKKDNVLKRMWR